jgi:hypothetical protein
MAYFIFLKYLRSLEEFRKNPHIKIPPKSPCANFQSLGIFKNQIFIRQRIFSVAFGPSGHSAQPRPIFFSFPSAFFPLPTGPRPLGQPISPSRPSRPRAGGALSDCRLSHGKTPPAGSTYHPSPIIPHLRLRPSRYSPTITSPPH